MKRSIDYMANYSMFQNHNSSIDFDQYSNIYYYSNSSSSSSSSSSSPTSRVFECKTCNRQFQSFQALGGHRASHKKPRLMNGSSDENSGNINNQTLIDGSSPVLIKPKTHECSICGLEFTIGQALGGHMRRHRASMIQNQPPPQFLGLNVVSSKLAPVVNKTTTSENITGRRVLFLDLNLTPLENDIKVLQFGKGLPLVQYCLL